MVSKTTIKTTIEIDKTLLYQAKLKAIKEGKSIKDLMNEALARTVARDRTQRDTKGANPYLTLLKKTKGTWHNDTWNRTVKVRSKTELQASQARKQAW